MKQELSVLSFLAIALLVEVGCQNSEPIAPSASEQLVVSVQTRAPLQGETVPAIHASPGSGSVTVRVTRGAMCATIVSAAVSRGVSQVDVVSQVSSNPAAVCAAIISTAVVDYTGTVNSLASGTYRIRVFEGVGNGTPKFIGSVLVTIA